MLSCMGISGDWRRVVRNLAVRVSRRKFRKGMPTSAHRLKARLVRKAPLINCTAEFWMVHFYVGRICLQLWRPKTGNSEI